jgi:hypothetical protein
LITESLKISQGKVSYDIAVKIKRLQREGVLVKEGKIVNFQGVCV